MANEVWAVGDAYDAFIGRWSRGIAADFVDWLAVPAGMRWLDVGCGTGALTAAVLSEADPAEVVGVDPAEGFLRVAREHVQDPRASFQIGDAMAIPVEDNGFDAVVSGLVVNFVPEPEQAVADFARVAKPGATVAAYVWDYAGAMDILRHFWDAAVALDPGAAKLNEGVRFSLCRPEPLQRLWEGAGLGEVEVRGIEQAAQFSDFDDYWRPFLGGQGPAAGYAMSLAEPQRAALREELRARVPQLDDGSVVLSTKAWAVRGLKV